MADRKVQIELQITANAQQARQVLQGLSGGGGGGGDAFTGLLSNFGPAALAVAAWRKVPTPAKLGTFAGSMAGGVFGGALVGGAIWAGIELGKFAEKLTDVSVSMSKIANPAAATLYELATRDLYGVIGQKLTPVVEIATDAVRMFGDFLASVLPSSKEIRAALAPLKDALKSITSALAAAAPVIKDVLTRLLLGMGRALAFVAGVLEGLFGSGGTLPNSARGAATRPAQIFGDLNSAIEAMNVAALSGASVEEEQANSLSHIDQTCGEIRDIIRDWRNAGSLAGKVITGDTGGMGWIGDLWYGFRHMPELNDKFFGTTPQ